MMSIKCLFLSFHIIKLPKCVLARTSHCETFLKFASSEAQAKGLGRRKSGRFSAAGHRQAQTDFFLTQKEFRSRKGSFRMMNDGPMDLSSIQIF